MNAPPALPWKLAGPLGVAGLVVAGAGFRLQGFGRLGLDHFDEGIYATASTWSLRPGGLSGLDPSLIPYAPPGYPILVGLAYTLFGPTDGAAIAVSILASLATIPVVALIARDWFGQPAALAAATFAAFSIAPITFSRMALTDATFLLAWCTGLWLGGRFLDRPGPTRAILFGATVGLAQLVKYNGWLIGGIVAITSLLGPMVDHSPPARSRLVRTLGWGLLAALISALVIWPWFRFVEGHGGYGALLKHQRSYLAGLDSWTGQLATQLRQATALGGPEWVGALVAAIAIWFAAFGSTATRRGLPGGRALLVCFALGGLILRPATSGWWLGLAVAPRLLFDREPGRRLLGVWWVVLSLLTPFYHPYARLWLPVEAAGWLLKATVIGVVVEAIMEQTAPMLRDRIRANRPRIASVGIALCLPWLFPDPTSRRARPLEPSLGPRDSFRTATARLVDRVPPEARSVRVLARPALAFYASGRLAGRGVAFGRVGSLADLLRSRDGYAIVDSAVLRQEGDLVDARARLVRDWDVVAEQETILSNATLLDVDPSAAMGDLSARSEPLLLIRPRPGGTRP